jgi:hypothetical protein
MFFSNIVCTLVVDAVMDRDIFTIRSVQNELGGNTGTP